MEINSRNENCTVNGQEDDVKVGSQEEAGIDAGDKKDDEESLFYGTIETQASEGAEADLHKHLVDCKKNPGHPEFIPVNDFKMNHLPEGYHDNDILEWIKATADLTVRLAVTMTSTERPEFLPNSNKPYPWYDKKGSNSMRLGTGMVYKVEKFPSQDGLLMCLCKKCQNSKTPSKVWGQVNMYTATHVVFDILEATHTTCRLFYDNNDSPLVTLDGWHASGDAISDDHCMLVCMTCDEDLLDKLTEMVENRADVWKKVNDKYMSSRDQHRLTFIVSHPHGCSKQVSIGQWIKRYKAVNNDKTKCTYTTCTCPGSSGATVHALGYVGLSYYRHVHSGAHSDGTNYSAAGQELP